MIYANSDQHQRGVAIVPDSEKKESSEKTKDPQQTNEASVNQQRVQIQSTSTQMTPKFGVINAFSLHSNDSIHKMDKIIHKINIYINSQFPE